MSTSITSQSTMLLRCFFMILATANSSSEPARAFSVVAYLPEWRYEGADWIQIAKHTSHLILFSCEITGNGKIIARDRMPRPELMKQARQATRTYGTKLIICFGGNGRSSGFAPMVRSKAYRKTFLGELSAIMDEMDLDGVDYNWEYPGYQFGRGYLSENEVKKDYEGLHDLLRETRTVFESRRKQEIITMSYYPDGRQEALLKGAEAHVDLFHMMSYDQGGPQHSSLKFGKQAVQSGLKHLPSHKLTMGLPFYGRHSINGDWVTYEDLLRDHQLVGHHKQALDSVPAKEEGAVIGFNGMRTISRKTKYAIKHGIGGVMIWEVGQDCRVNPVTHGTTTHVTTCAEGENSSLLAGIHRTLHAADLPLSFAIDSEEAIQGNQEL